MNRVQISATVDGDVLARCRAVFDGTDSEMADRALRVLLDQLETKHELEALRAIPYDADPDLNWVVPTQAGLHYDGEPPIEVVELVRQRRSAS